MATRLVRFVFAARLVRISRILQERSAPDTTSETADGVFLLSVWLTYSFDSEALHIRRPEGPAFR